MRPPLRIDRHHVCRPAARRLGITLVLLVAVAFGGAEVLADDVRLSRDEAVELVRERTDGRILGVDTRNGDTFRIRVLVREGEVRVYEVDRRSGEVRH